ncbi:hypothetical protein GCM10009116_11590 [Brevundimonas basaltis]|uniref:Lipoprotein n=1 Tax=Brevundimonas basaltis TaxID=472166 RepID=A0A7W8HX71_9CAUL|nr:hypothetical protein [Brevundimonas basaltis]MBB5290597.1 hypothetical protein [Brevundimonas basaltis]
MRTLLIAATALLTGCATHTPPATPAGPPDRIEVVYSPATMFFSIEDGGAARFTLSEKEDYLFPVTHDDYVRIRDLLQPYREKGLVCAREEPWEHNGYLVWRENGVETRRPHESICYAEGHREAGRGISRAYYAVKAMAEERWVPPPGLPDPTRMTLTWLSWGNMQERWDIPRGGDASWAHRDGRTTTFAVSPADFDRVRDLFRPYEGAGFECERVVADLPYGRLVWSQPGHEDQELGWDRGCITGDAADVFRRVDEAEAFLMTLRDRA